MNNSGIITHIIIVLIIVGLLLTVTGLISYISFSDKGLEVNKISVQVEAPNSTSNIVSEKNIAIIEINNSFNSSS